jgi:hypothetical protein
MATISTGKILLTQLSAVLYPGTALFDHARSTSTATEGQQQADPTPAAPPCPVRIASWR